MRPATAFSAVVTPLGCSLGTPQGHCISHRSLLTFQRLCRLRPLVRRFGLTVDVWLSDWIDACSHKSPPVSCYRLAPEKLYPRLARFCNLCVINLMGKNSHWIRAARDLVRNS